ncbi:MAG: SDR family oxidoreductase [Betaproteobacteria bacterium]|nr:SDR family oxidoreductase [Betaproteobacteria bacterium]MDH5220405.1 SDR family oxidoreductase [Betaproteobacteria bacterium]
MELGLKGRIALVTGATQGIGWATSRLLAREGARVALVARGRERLERCAQEIAAAGGEALALQCDVSRAEDIERAVKAVTGRWGGLDILVNNAGTSMRGEFESVDDVLWQADLDLKLMAAVRLSRLAVPLMRARGGGRIVNVTNIGGKQPEAGTMPTTVTRAAGMALTKALSKEYARDNILVNTVCIGRIKAGQWETRAKEQGVPVEKLYEQMGRQVPLGRVGEAEEVANVIAFLVSAAASYVTGTSVNLDGGMSGVL